MGSRPTRWIIVVGAAAMVVAHAGPALAASITINPNPQRELGENHSESIEKRYYVTRADCVSDDAFLFRATIRDAGNYNLEVWASQSSDCSTYNERRSNGVATCWRVFAEDAKNDSYTIRVRMQDIATLASNGREVEGQGSAEDCEPGDLATGGMKLKLYFLLVNGSELGGTAATFDTGIDLTGPAAPTGVATQVAEDKLKVSWEITDSDDWAGYRIYCASAADAASAGGATADTGGSPGATGAASNAGGVPGAAGAAPSNGGAVSAAGASGEATGAGGSPTSASGGTTGSVQGACDFGVLVPGAIPDDTYRCGEGETILASEGLATGLADGTTFAVGVSGVDLLGNPGPLSNVVCGTPQPVTTFFEAYREAGGTAGGGFCAFSRARTPASLGALFAAASLLGARRRRRARA
ncbi:MAG TPA: hypothetical protein PLU22_16265 [Polyangiaceae bacterium]|nr:hypothetical protein [Polyangiaceae bacterium]